MRHSSVRVPAVVIVGDKSSSHCDRGGVTKAKIVQAKHQTLPCGTKCFTNILKKKKNILDFKSEQFNMSHVLYCI